MINQAAIAVCLIIKVSNRADAEVGKDYAEVASGHLHSKLQLFYDPDGGPCGRCYHVRYLFAFECIINIRSSDHPFLVCGADVGAAHSCSANCSLRLLEHPLRALPTLKVS